MVTRAALRLCIPNTIIDSIAMRKRSGCLRNAGARLSVMPLSLEPDFIKYFQNGGECFERGRRCFQIFDEWLEIPSQ